MFHLIHAKSLFCQRSTFKEVNDWGPIKFERPHEKVLEKWKEKNIKKDPELEVDPILKLLADLTDKTDISNWNEFS